MKPKARNIKIRLRKEKSANFSGKMPKQNKIAHLKNEHYYVEEHDLDGDAPKQFIRVYLYEEKSGIRKKNLKTWIPFIAKSGEKWYPHESIVEYLLNRIGDVIGLNMNDTKLLIINGQIRFLSRYFLRKDEVMIHGAEICGEYLDDDALAKEIANNKQDSRELFTFQFIEKAIQNVFAHNATELLTCFVKMLIFDALVGNNDRHFYNWAIIRPVKRIQIAPRFAPIYDTARGLFWNWSDDRIIESLRNYHKKHGQKLENYLKNAYPRVSLDDDAEINHFELIDFLVEKNKLYKDIVLELSSLKNERRVVQMIKDEFRFFFIEERLELVILAIKFRFNYLRKKAKC